jgi:hypothetical protein
MTTPEPITEDQAKAALAAIENQFKVYIQAYEGTSRPILRQPGHEGPFWSIDWEEGPTEWALRAFHGGIDWDIINELKAEGVGYTDALKVAQDPAVACPEGVFAEPVNSFILGLYPAF